MSSPISPPLVESEAALVSAASDVAENCLFTFVDPSDESVFSAHVASTPPEAWFTARLRFSGPSAGEFGLTAPDGLVRRLCGAFSGEEAADTMTAKALTDFVGELANMVCGAWLTRVSPAASFDLTAPSVSPGVSEVPAGSAVAHGRTFFVTMDETPVRFFVIEVPRQGVARAS